MAVFLVMRLEENGSLRSFLNAQQGVSLTRARELTIDIILGLEFLHHQNIVHGDLKPDNILLDSNLRAHVADFGLCRVGGPGVRFFGRWGSPGYESPEQLMGNVEWDFRTDYFVLGVMFCQMLEVSHPFGENIPMIERNVMRLAYKLPIMPQTANLFVRALLCKMDRRLSVESIQRHPFINHHIDATIASYEPYIKIVNDIPELEFFDGVNFFPPIPYIDAPVIEEQVRNCFFFFPFPKYINLGSNANRSIILGARRHRVPMVSSEFCMQFFVR